jgi:hypothetical protein
VPTQEVVANAPDAARMARSPPDTAQIIHHFTARAWVFHITARLPRLQHTSSHYW